jgi:hypothetical protein
MNFLKPKVHRENEGEPDPRPRYGAITGIEATDEFDGPLDDSSA